MVYSSKEKVSRESSLVISGGGVMSAAWTNKRGATAAGILTIAVSSEDAFFDSSEAFVCLLLMAATVFSHSLHVHLTPSQARPSA